MIYNYADLAEQIAHEYDFEIYEMPSHEVRFMFEDTFGELSNADWRLCKQLINEALGE